MALTDKIKAIADAIRSKTGKTETMTMEQMVTEIEGIESGGGGGEKILYMDAALLNAGGAYPADADDYTTAVIPAEATFVSLEVFDNLPNIDTVIINGNCEFETYGEYDSSAKATVYRNALVAADVSIRKLCIFGRDAIPNNFAQTMYSLAEVEIDACPSIGNYAFSNCRALRRLTIGTMGDIWQYAFDSCYSLRRVDIQTAQGASPIFDRYSIGNAKIEELVIPDGVTGISAYAFYTCNKLKTVTIPASVGNIGSYAFPNIAMTIRGYAGSKAESFVVYCNTNMGCQYTFEVISQANGIEQKDDVLSISNNVNATQDGDVLIIQ